MTIDMLQPNESLKPLVDGILESDLGSVPVPLHPTIPTGSVIERVRQHLSTSFSLTRPRRRVIPPGCTGPAGEEVNTASSWHAWLNMAVPVAPSATHLVGISGSPRATGSVCSGWRSPR